MLKIYTDGSCRNNGAPDAVGAWGYIIKGKDFEFAQCDVVKGTTNQRMELAAILYACRASGMDMGMFDSAEVYTDSAYFHQCVTQKWYVKWVHNGWFNSRNEPVANRDLWEALLVYILDPRFSFFKVKGHADNEMNNRVDAMVQAASREAVNGTH